MNEILDADEIPKIQPLANEYNLQHQNGTISGNGGQILFEIMKDKVKNPEKLMRSRPRTMAIGTERRKESKQVIIFLLLSF